MQLLKAPSQHTTALHVAFATLLASLPAAAITPSDSFCDEAGNGCSSGEVCDASGTWGEACDDGFCNCYVGECIFDEECGDAVCQPDDTDEALICSDGSGGDFSEAGCAAGGVPPASIGLALLLAFLPRRRKPVRQ